MTTFKGTVSGEDIRSILTAATVLVEECRVFFQEDKVKIRGTDPGGVALVIIEISEDAFDDVTVKEEDDVCWDFSEMTDMIRMADKDTDIDLEIDNNKLIIDFIDLHFTLSLIDPDALKNDTKKPDMDLAAEIILESSVFKRGVNAAGLVAEHVEFGIDDDESAFYMEAKGDVNEVILRRKKRDLVTLSADPASSTYSVHYLNRICAAIPDNTEVEIALGNDLPAEISYKIAGGKATVTYFIAPRLQPNT